MRKSSIAALLFATAFLGHAGELPNKPSGYLSLDEVEIEEVQKPAEPAKAAITAAPAAAAGVGAAAQPALAPALAVSVPTSAPAAVPAQPVVEHAAKPPEAAPLPVYQAKIGASLRDTLDTWAKQAGWQPVSWMLPADLDFTIGIDARHEGDFVSAARSFVDSLGCEAELRILFNPTARIALVEPL